MKYCISNVNFIGFKMKKNKYNANAELYSAFLEGKTTKEENYIVLKQMMRDSRLIMMLNLAASTTCSKKMKKNSIK